MKAGLLFAFTAIAFVGCNRPAAPTAESPDGATFKSGHGVKLPAEMQVSLGLKIIDVGERSLRPRVEIPLHVVRSTFPDAKRSELNGWITDAQSTALRPESPGTAILPDGSTALVTVNRVEKSAHPALGDHEITATIDVALPEGTAIKAAFSGSPSGEVVAVPASAVMKTAEGEFVYAVNDDHFQRVPVATGLRGEDSVEITDGLYAGDQIVSAPVAPLWLTELQTLRAGQSCCEGH